MYCIACGDKIQEEWDFCPTCGHRKCCSGCGECQQCPFCGDDRHPGSHVRLCERTITLDVPVCWERLIEEEFEVFNGGLFVRGTNRAVKSEKHVRGPDDPEACYDDCRTVAGRFRNGASVCLDLTSGQHNYYGGLTIHKENGVIYDSGVLESLPRKWHAVSENGDVYVVNVNPFGDDPYRGDI